MDPKNGLRDISESLDGPPDSEAVERVKEILLLLTRAVSAMKLFPVHHATVIHFREELFDKINKFLEEHWELEFHIEENSFLYEGEIVFQEDSILKSLPYLFFKDGLFEMAFLRDLDKDELLAFMDVIRRVSLLPLDESDIVDALWEKDFPHIRYFAPDEFLEGRLAASQIHPGDFKSSKYNLDLKIDTDKLFQGKIELSREDLEDISKKLLTLHQKENKDVTEFASLEASLDKGDMSAIDAMLGSARDLSTEKDLLDLMFELLYLEDRIEPFKMILSFLDKRYREEVQKADFSHAVQMINQMEELAQALSAKSPERTSEIGKFLQTLNSQSPLESLRDMVRQGKIRDVRSFFVYLQRLGPAALPVGAELLEDDHEPGIRSEAFDFLAEMGKENLLLLANLAHDRKPFISKSIIAIFDHLNDKRVIPFLAPFMNYKNKEVKIEAIRVLGRFPDPLAHKILIGFLRDEDEEVRVAAAQKILVGQNKTLLNAVIQSASEKDFHEKSLREKEAVLQALGRSRADEVCAFLGSFLEKSSILEKLGNAKIEETRLCAIRVLETMATSKASETLGSGAAHGHGKKVREACREAVDRLAAAKEKT